MLGEFEYLLLSAAAKLGENAYGAAIRAETGKATGKVCSIGALYTTLDRLEAKGLIETWMGAATRNAAAVPSAWCGSPAKAARRRPASTPR
jgi:PadR family transcriptional regulator, regulatory protein PadR